MCRETCTEERGARRKEKRWPRPARRLETSYAKSCEYHLHVTRMPLNQPVVRRKLRSIGGPEEEEKEESLCRKRNLASFLPICSELAGRMTFGPAQFTSA